MHSRKNLPLLPAPEAAEPPELSDLAGLSGLTGLTDPTRAGRLAVAPVAGKAPGDDSTSTDAIPVASYWLGSWQLSVRRRAFGARDLIAAYDKKARDWQRLLRRLGYDRAYRALLTPAVEQLTPPAAGMPLRALDCGIGTGALTAALAAVAGGSIDAHGVDTSPAMLTEAARAFAHQRLSVDLRCADVSALPYEDDQFDITMAAHLLEHFTEPQAALEEMVRVTRPGGLVVVCLTRPSALGFLIHLQWRTRMVSPDAARGWLTACGLTDIACESDGCTASFRRRSHAWIGRKPLIAD